MIFTNLDHKKNNMEETIEALRIEIIDLVKLRDTVLNEIRDQRGGINELRQTLQSEDIKKQNLSEAILRLTDTLRIAPIDFIKYTAGQLENIKQFNAEIEILSINRDKLIQIEGEFIEKEKMLIKKDIQLREKIKEVGEQSDILTGIIKQKEQFDREMIEQSEEIKKQMEKNLLEASNIEKQGIVLNLLEGRLTKLRRELSNQKLSNNKS